MDSISEISSSSHIKHLDYSKCEIKEESKENLQITKLSPREKQTSSALSRKRSFSDVLYNDINFQSPPTGGYKRLHEKHQSSRYSLPEMEKRRLDDHARRKSVPYDKYQRRSFCKSEIKRSTTDQTPYSPYFAAKRQRTILPRYNLWSILTCKSGSFIDTHCHLDFLFQRQSYEGTYKSYQELHKNTFPECYEGCIAIFCNPFTFAEKLLWKPFLKEENVWAAFGCHPHNSEDYSDDVEASLKKAIRKSKVLAFGEIGLDYSKRNNCEKEVQHKVFKRQLKIAKKHHLPLVIHCREAHEDCLKILKKVIPDDYLIHLHCFTDTWDWAKVWLDTFPNLYIGMTNVVTFPSAETVHDVAKNIPLDRLLLETDAPYFVPRQIARETRWSHPGMAIHVAGQVAALRGIPIDSVLRFARQNTKKMYGV